MSHLKFKKKFFFEHLIPFLTLQVRGPNNADEASRPTVGPVVRCCSRGRRAFVCCDKRGGALDHGPEAHVGRSKKKKEIKVPKEILKICHGRRKQYYNKVLYTRALARRRREHKLPRASRRGQVHVWMHKSNRY